MNRRTFLRCSLAGGLASAIAQRASAGRAPARVRSPGSTPTIPQGVASGDVGGGRAIVWSRCDRPARMFIEYATTETFRNSRTVRGPMVLEGSDFTGRVALTSLPPGQRIFYRVRFEDVRNRGVRSDPATGSFSTQPASDTHDVTVAWSADTVGQGWGINPDFGGLRLYETMRDAQPDIFIHCGDTIYADAPLAPVVTLDNGTVWRNVVTPAKSKVAESLDEYRGNYQYNLQDEHMQRFNAEVAQVVIWDDHEVRDNWYATRDLTHDDRYKTKSAAVLAARARQAFAEYNPLPDTAGQSGPIFRSVPCGPLLEILALDLRSYRGANSENRQTQLTDHSRIAGRRQSEWIKSRLASSRAVWKVIASDMPVGAIIPDGATHLEGIANGHDGPPSGRELELADILRFIRDRRIRNVIWVTGDIHYCAAHYYDPSRARFTEFDPFWEFVAGPLHAGTFGPSALDATFGPEVKFVGIPPGMKPNRPPSDGLQFFGLLKVQARTRALSVSLHNLAGEAIYRVELEPSR